MQPTESGQVVPERAHGEADGLDDVFDDEATRFIRRAWPRHEAAAPASTASSKPDLLDGLDDDDTLIVPRDIDEHTRIVARTADDNTRIAARRRPGNRPVVHSEPESDAPNDSEPTDEATVRSSRGSTVDETLLSSRRTVAPAHIPVVDALQRRYEPPQVPSGASVRYAARPAPTIVEPKAPAVVPDPAPDVARIRLADVAAEIPKRAAATFRRRRRFTLIAIILSTGLMLIALSLTFLLPASGS